MQLGELQNQYHRFVRRSAAILAISVDPPTDSQAMIARLGLKFDLASDPQQQIVKTFGVQNPDTQQLALHAVYIIDRNGLIIYRKVARRRPVSAELIDAIDVFRGDYPQSDIKQPPRRINVAYPQNNFQALIEIAKADQPSDGIDQFHTTKVLDLIKARRSDDAIFAFRTLVQNSKLNSDQLLRTAAWVVRTSYFANLPEAVATGKDLSRRLQRVAELEAGEISSQGTAEHDKVLHTLAAARAGLTRVRANIDANAEAWNLRYAKTSLRGYREVVLAQQRNPNH